MGKIKCSLCFKKKQAKKLTFDPKIALEPTILIRPEIINFAPTFWMSAYSVVSFSATLEILNHYIGEAGGSAN